METNHLTLSRGFGTSFSVESNGSQLALTESGRFQVIRTILRSRLVRCFGLATLAGSAPPLRL
jgi:hypothetical protein